MESLIIPLIDFALRPCLCRSSLTFHFKEFTATRRQAGGLPDGTVRTKTLGKKMLPPTFVLILYWRGNTSVPISGPLENS